MDLSHHTWLFLALPVPWLVLPNPLPTMTLVLWSAVFWGGGPLCGPLLCLVLCWRQGALGRSWPWDLVFRRHSQGGDALGWSLHPCLNNAHYDVTFLLGSALWLPGECPQLPAMALCHLGATSLSPSCTLSCSLLSWYYFSNKFHFLSLKKKAHLLIFNYVHVCLLVGLYMCTQRSSGAGGRWLEAAQGGCLEVTS